MNNRINSLSEETKYTTVSIEEIQMMQELSTAKSVMETVVPVSDHREIFGNRVATTKLLFVAHGEVRAGIDLGELSPEDLLITGGNKVVVNLPPAKIFSVTIDPDKSTVFDHSQGLLNLGPDTLPQLQLEAQSQATALLVNNACTNLLPVANQQAEVILTGFLKGLGFEEVSVITSNQFVCSHPLDN